jgi:IQ domain-containing protein D
MEVALREGAQILNETVGNLVIPTKKKLTSVEAERIVSVLETTIRKAEIVAIVSNASSRMSEFEKLLPSQGVQLLREHVAQERAFSTSTSRAMTPKSTRMSFAHDPGVQLTASTRNLVRYFMNTPAALYALKSKQFEISPKMKLFIRQLKMMQQHVFENLLTTVEEETDKQEHLAGLLARERRLANEVCALRIVEHFLVCTCPSLLPSFISS